MQGSGYSIGLVTPFNWTRPHHVNAHVAQLAEQLTARGHRVTIITPTTDRSRVRLAKQRVREVLMDDRDSVFDVDEPYPRYFFPGGTYGVRLNRSTRLVGASVDFTANTDVLLRSERFDVLHLHEPFVPGPGWTGLQWAHCPLIATFHTDSESYRSYWMARGPLQRYFDAFDSVLATTRAVRDAVWRAFQGEVSIVPGGIDYSVFSVAAAGRHDAAGTAKEPFRLLYAGGRARRDGLRLLLRSLRRLDDLAPAFKVDICGDDRLETRYEHLVPEPFLPAATFHGLLTEPELAERMAAADVLCVPSLETDRFEARVPQAMAAGVTVVAADVAGIRELVEDGREGMLVAPGRTSVLAHALRELAGDPERRAALGAAGRVAARRYDWETVTGEIEAVYEAAVSRRHGAATRPSPPRSSAGLAQPADLALTAAAWQVRAHEAGGRESGESEKPEAILYADFHMHSDHSDDCVVPVRELLVRARQCGLDVIAITDHNSAEGGLEGQKLAAEHGVQVIVGEEVKTAEGEVVGLFLERTIPGGLSFAETLEAIREQNGIVYLPHPFDRLHTVPSYGVLKRHVDEIDVVEVFNSRLAFPAFNERAELFAQRYRIAAAAGSDAHVLASLGTAMTAMARFTGRDDFMEALADSRIIRRPKSYLYLTGLKFIQTSLEGARRSESAAPNEPPS